MAKWVPFAICTILAFASRPAVAADLIEKASRAWDIKGLEGVEVWNHRGSTTLRPSADGRLHLVALKHVHPGGLGDSQELARKTRLEANRQGDRLRIDVIYPQRRQIRIGIRELMRGIELPEVEMDLVLDVPSGLEVALHSSSGDLGSEGIASPQFLETSSGDVDVVGARGPLRIETSSGDAELTGIGRARIRTASGDVTVGTARGPLVVTTGGGDVSVESAADSLVLTSGSGDLSVADARRGLEAHTGSGDVVARASGRVGIETASGEARVALVVPVASANLRSQTGDLSLRLDRRLACRLDVATTSGEIDLRLPLDVESATRRRVVGAVGGGSAPVTLRSSSGSIIVQR